MAFHDVMSVLKGPDGRTTRSRGTCSLVAFSQSCEPLMRLLEKVRKNYGMITNHVRKAALDIAFALASAAPGHDGGGALSDEDWLSLVHDFELFVTQSITYCVDQTYHDLRKRPDEYDARTAERMGNGHSSFFFMTAAQRRTIREDIKDLAVTAQRLVSLDRS